VSNERWGLVPTLEDICFPPGEPLGPAGEQQRMIIRWLDSELAATAEGVANRDEVAIARMKSARLRAIDALERGSSLSQQ
jgi:hypothetical protein